jgi:hypothetical protein
VTPQPFDTVMVSSEPDVVALLLGLEGEGSPRGWLLMDPAEARIVARSLREAAAMADGEDGITNHGRQVRLQSRRRQRR